MCSNFDLLQFCFARCAYNIVALVLAKLGLSTENLQSLIDNVLSRMAS
jgi:hypothetical protein